MSNHKNQNQNQNQKSYPALQKPGLDGLGLATLAGVVAVLMISFSNLKAIDNLQDRIDDKLDRVDDRISQMGKTQVQAQVNPTQQTPPPARRGPDPAKAYTIKVANAPTKGAANAPITIAEFSDFQ